MRVCSEQRRVGIHNSFNDCLKEGRLELIHCIHDVDRLFDSLQRHPWNLEGKGSKHPRKPEQLAGLDCEGSHCAKVKYDEGLRNVDSFALGHVGFVECELSLSEIVEGPKNGIKLTRLGDGIMKCKVLVCPMHPPSLRI